MKLEKTSAASSDEDGRVSLKSGDIATREGQLTHGESRVGRKREEVRLNDRLRISDHVSSILKSGVGRMILCRIISRGKKYREGMKIGKC